MRGENDIKLNIKISFSCWFSILQYWHSFIFYKFQSFRAELIKKYLTISSTLILRILLSKVWISKGLLSIASASDVSIRYINSFPFLVYLWCGIYFILKIKFDTVRWMFSCPSPTKVRTFYSPKPGFISINLVSCFIVVVLPSKFRTFLW